MRRLTFLASFILISVLMARPGWAVVLSTTEALLQPGLELPKPFWKSKPELMAKIHDDRAIIVSVKATEIGGADKVQRLTVAGVGDVSKPLAFCFARAQEYTRLPQISDHFKTAIYNEDKRQLSLLTQALGYQARMILQMTPSSSPDHSELTWEVIWGEFKGMHGVFGLERVSDRKTEVSIVGEFEAKKLPLPKILMGFALEVVVQKVAEKMRSYIEGLPDDVSAAPAPSTSPSPAENTHSSMMLKSDVSDHSL
jgi:hypothetical protein